MNAFRSEQQSIMMDGRVEIDEILIPISFIKTIIYRVDFVAEKRQVKQTTIFLVLLISVVVITNLLHQKIRLVCFVWYKMAIRVSIVRFRVLAL